MPRAPWMCSVKWRDGAQGRMKRLARIGGTPCLKLANLVAVRHPTQVLECGRESIDVNKMEVND